MEYPNHIEIEYDRSKDRQGLFDEAFFKQSYKDNLAIMNLAIQSISNYPNDAPSQIPACIYLLVITEYTAGFPIEAVRQRFEQAIEYSRLCLDINAKYPIDDPELLADGWTMSVWGGGMDLSESLSNAIGLCILFDRTDWLEIIKQCYELDGFRDISFDALINMLIPTEFDPQQRFPRGGFNFRKPLLQAIMADSKEKTLKYLNAYLAGWYEGNRKIGNPIIDRHLYQDPEYGGYYGYWSFESAAVAYLKEIDDAELYQYLYYPKDMVEWAREQRRIGYAKQNSESQQPLLLSVGKPVPFSGKYGVDNFSGFERYFQAGDILPNGQVSGKRDTQGNPVFRQDTIWRLLSREDGGSTRFTEDELEKYYD